MKTLTFNTKSLHYRVAKFGLGSYNDPSEDICSYVTEVALGTLKLSLAFMSGAVLATMSAKLIVEVVLSVAFSIYYSTYLSTTESFIGLCIISICLIGLVVTRISAIHRNRSQNKPDSFIRSAYRSVKNKYCVKIKFV